MWQDEKHIAFDFETSGTEPEYALQPWRLDQGLAWATSFVWAGRFGKDTTFRGGLKPTISQMCEMLEHAIAYDKTIIGWNTTFDISWLIAYGLRDLVYRCKWLDGMLLWRHLDIEPEYDITDRFKKRSYGLKPAVEKFLPEHAGYAEDVDFHDPSPEARAKLHAYNKRDVLFTLVITKKLYRLLEQNPQQLKAALIEARCLPLIAEANLQGMPVNVAGTLSLSEKLADDAETYLSELSEHGVTEKVIRSPVQLSKLIFDDWGLPVIKQSTSSKTGKVSRSTDKEVLHELSFIDDRIATLRAYRNALNDRTKFAEAPLESSRYNGDGRTRPSAIVFGTYSGRLTYASKQGRNKDARPIGFALHQMKREKIYRDALQAPEGYTLIEFDAAGQEFRWMAVASQDQTMLSLCAPGEDAHSFMAAQIDRSDYRDMIARVRADEEAANQSRFLGKVGNLCVAGDTLILTDRGPVPIVDVTTRDRVWDGEEFVLHDGVTFSGVRPVMSYGGIIATPDHKVLVSGRWERLDEAARHGWQIEPALGTGWTCNVRASIRIVDGLVRRAVSEIWGAIRHGALCLWQGAGGKPAILGDRAEHALQGMCHPRTACAAGASGDYGPAHTQPAKTRERLVSEMSQPRLNFIPQLRRAWNRVQIFFCGRGRALRADPLTAPDIPQSGYRSGGQRRALRAGQPAFGDTQGQLGEPPVEPVYDIVNCGPRTRFAANGVIVHNSLQYRTSAKKLRSVARVQYNIPMTQPEADHIRGTYLRSYPGVPIYWKRQIALTRSCGFVETFAGRRVKVVGNWDGSWGWSMGSTAINYRIQGTGADQKYLAMAVLRDYLPKVNGRFGWDLHDGIYLFIPDEHVERVTHEGKYLLDNLPYKQAWGFTPPTPMPWDCKRGPSWGKLKEYQYG